MYDPLNLNRQANECERCGECFPELAVFEGREFCADCYEVKQARKARLNAERIESARYSIQKQHEEELSAHKFYSEYLQKERGANEGNEIARD